jgi:hypothetical protein
MLRPVAKLVFVMLSGIVPFIQPMPFVAKQYAREPPKGSIAEFAMGWGFANPLNWSIASHTCAARVRAPAIAKPTTIVPLELPV